MSTITLLTVLQVISDRKTAILKDLERIDTDKRVKNADVQKPALYARIDECDKILNLLKEKFDVTPAAKWPTGPIYDPGNHTGQLPGPFSERTSSDALGNTEEGANGPGLVNEGTNAGEFLADYKRASKGPDPLHPV